jgi:hypothetical protein
MGEGIIWMGVVVVVVAVEREGGSGEEGVGIGWLLEWE